MPEEFYLQKYINRLNEKIAKKVIEEDIETLNDAMKRTKQIKKGRNYKKPKTETTKTEIQSNPFLKEYKENPKKSNIDLIKELTKQFNKMKINYVQLMKENKKKI